MNDTVKFLLPLLITAMVSIAGSWLMFKNNAQANDNALVEVLLKEVRELKRDVEANELKLQACMDSKQELNNALLTFKNYHKHLPRPAWFVDSDGKILWVNMAYEVEFGATSLQMEGRYAYEIWGEDFGRSFMAEDSIVMSGKRPRDYIKQVPKKFNDFSEVYNWRIIKFPVDSNGEIIGVGGIALQNLGKI